MGDKQKIVFTIMLCIIATACTVNLIEKYSPSKVSTGSVATAGAGLYHTIPEMQIWCGANPDGIWGMETDRLYKQKIQEQNGNEYAIKLYEETK